MILEGLYFALPVYMANMAPVFFVKVNFLNYQISRKYFGEHKTYRGFFFGIIFAMITAFLQYLLYPYFKNISILNYDNFLLIGFLMGFGALFGDLIRSFFKRRIGIKPSGKWIPFDQLDFIAGGLLFISIYYFPGFKIIVFLLIITPFLHIIVTHIGYYLGVRKTRF